MFLAIVDRKTGAHIGNIKLGPIHPIHRYASLGILIGEKQFWGRNYGLEVVELMVDYGFKQLNLHKITLGVYDDHTASLRLFEKAGFSIEGRLREQLFRDGEYHDKVLMAMRRDEYLLRRTGQIEQRLREREHANVN